MGCSAPGRSSPCTSAGSTRSRPGRSRRSSSASVAGLACREVRSWGHRAGTEQLAASVGEDAPGLGIGRIVLHELLDSGKMSHGASVSAARRKLVGGLAGGHGFAESGSGPAHTCLLYTSDAAD